MLPLTRRRGGRIEIHRDFASVMACAAESGLVAVGVDMPIGLTSNGRRSADVEARSRLGPRRSSLFPTPPLAVLDAADFADAQLRCRAASGGTGISIQAWNLVPKIREVSEALTPADQPRIAEVHPESSFTALAGRPLAPKRTPEGRAERRRVLADQIPDLDHILDQTYRGAAPDDLLDALAAAWTARRMATGRAEWLGDGEIDPRGFRCTIAV
ncbi:MAG: DUF429 domain-containing protein [Acidimicrobiales bacterium]|nr:DUF429 domain-containing protein [Acidimicrobiales bacterium]